MPVKKKRKIVVGNWKMNVVDVAEAKRVMTATKTAGSKLKNTDVVACPPFVFFGSLKASPKVALGAQDVYFEERGSHTGEVSVPMLLSVAASHVIIGHCERRKMGETDAVVAEKVAAALKGGLTAVVCVGENVRDTQGDYLGFLREQIKGSFAKVQKKMLSALVVAYEPVWAIGAAEAMTANDVHETTIFIKKTLSDMFGQDEALKIPILYGGAVNFRNAQDIIVGGEVDGLLVGRESVNPPGFAELLKAVDAI